MKHLHSDPSPSERQAAQTLKKAIKLLEALAEPHSQGTGDHEHEWRRCRRCLAHEELEHKGTDVLLNALLDAVKGVAK